MAARSSGGGRTLVDADRLRLAARCLGAALVGLAVMTEAAVARADDAQALEWAKSPFDNGNYKAAQERLSALLDPRLPPCDAAPTPCHLTNAELVERARALDAASLVALKKDAEADPLIAAILRANPNYTPSPAIFPQDVIDRFNAVRASLDTELRAIVEQRAREAEAKRLAAQRAHDAEEAWIADLRDRAGKERWVVQNSRWVALIPFGIGQFQNGDVRLGVTFAVGEVLLGATSLISVAVANRFVAVDPNQPTATANGPLYPSISGLNANLNTWSLVNQVSFTAWAALTAAGVVQAQVAFVPEKVTIKNRPVPPRPSLAPVAVPVRGGAVLGLSGTF